MTIAAEPFNALRYSQCERKRPMGKRHAWLVAYRVGLVRGLPYQPYHCPYSPTHRPHFHIGRPLAVCLGLADLVAGHRV